MHLSYHALEQDALEQDALAVLEQGFSCSLANRVRTTHTATLPRPAPRPQYQRQERERDARGIEPSARCIHLDLSRVNAAHRSASARSVLVLRVLYMPAYV